MELGREQKGQWVARLPGLPTSEQRGLTNTSVTSGNEERINEHEGLQDMEEISPRQAGMSIDPRMEEAIRIYKSYIWGCKNLSWLFNEGVPEWLDTDPAEWHAVRRILQEFKHHDFIRQFPIVRKGVDTKLSEANYSDSERTDPHDFPDVRIVCRNDSRHKLKSCLKIRCEGHLATNVIKMVIVGSIDIDLFVLTEAEIDWKSIPLSLERVEINGRYIRDMSKREMDVRKLYELDLMTVKTLDGDDLATLDSRRELCELYNQKLRVQLADFSSPNPLELPSGDEVLEQSCEISKPVLLTEVENKVIPPHKSTKHTLIGRMKEAYPPQWRNGQSTCDGRGCNQAHPLTTVTKTGEYDQQPTSEPIVNSERSAECFDDFLNDSKATPRQNKKDSHREITSPILVQSLEDLLSQNKTIEQGNKTNANRQILPSSSVQSLDDLLNEALEAEEEFERRHTEKSSTLIKSSPMEESNIAKLQIVNECWGKREQSFQSLSGLAISPIDNCGILTISGETDLLIKYKKTIPQVDLALQDLHISSKQGANTDGILASTSHQSKGSQRALRENRVSVLQGEISSGNPTQDKFSEEKTGHLEYCERPKSSRCYPVPLETYRQVPIKCSLDNDVERTGDFKKDLPPSRCCSNLSLFSELSADDWVLLRQGNTELSKSATTRIPGVHISGPEKSHESSPDTADRRYLNIPHERSRDNRRFNFFRRHLSSFRKKLRKFNCFSKP